ncbi:KAP family P-loop NTPase fold protein [Achromobacter ruhlandii]|uniref:KAP family P-loop NTPase fold protein n=1 Tax=Achromobacter ruhlandii TaxID=72557 RepID=UPI001EED3193|nr:P-loop NTPase fold protein [Achromobacter ruhlandii]MCZ8399759.1 P-loop NTPase fold protein [Achromobacter ruhlandii]
MNAKSGPEYKAQVGEASPWVDAQTLYIPLDLPELNIMNIDSARPNASELLADQPSARGDQYGRTSFARQIGNLLTIRPGSPGIVVGIEGPWGSGKSSIIEMIKNDLSGMRESGPIIVQFSPWMLSGSEALVEALLTELAAGINEGAEESPTEKTLRVSKRILGYVGLLRHLKYLKHVPGVSLVGISAEVVGKALATAGSFAEDIGNGVDEAHKIVSDVETALTVQNSLHRRKAEVEQALIDLDRSILVVVDDVDRLTPAETVEVFRTIKAVADFPGVAYLVTYDREVVSDSLGNGNQAGGEAYLDKIVQVAYPLAPAFPWQLRSHLKAVLGDRLDHSGRLLESFEELLMPQALKIACSLCRHPRDIIRLANRLTLSLVSTKHNANAADVLVAEAVFQRFPRIRDALARTPQHFVQERFTVKGKLTDLRFADEYAHSKVDWSRYLPKDPAEAAVCNAALDFLFSEPLNGKRSTVSDLRICDPWTLIRFLVHTSLDGIPNTDHIFEWLIDPAKAGIGSRIRQSDLREGQWLIQASLTFVDSRKDIDHVGLFQELQQAYDYAKLEDDEWTSNLAGLAELAAKCTHHFGSEKMKHLLDFIQHTPLVLGQEVLLQLKEIAKRSDLHYANAFNAGEFSQCVETWLKIAEDAFRSGAVIKERNLIALLSGMGQLANDREVRAYHSLMALCHRPEGLDYVMQNEKSLSSSHRIFGFLGNGEELASLIRNSPKRASYEWFIDRMKQDQAALILRSFNYQPES